MPLISFEAALRDPRHRIGVRDFSVSEGAAFSIYAIGAGPDRIDPGNLADPFPYHDPDTGAEEIARSVVPLEKAEAMIADLRRLGLRVGATFGPPYVWAWNDLDFEVWSRDKLIAAAESNLIWLRSIEFWHREIVEVIAFLSSDGTSRGVNVIVKGGGTCSVADEVDPKGSAADWAPQLGWDLAAWLKKEFRETRDGMTLAKRKAAMGRLPEAPTQGS